jgi:hypothetical protein
MSQLSVEDRFALLDDQRRRLVHRLALGDDDVDLAKSRQVQLGAHCGDINEIAQTLNVAGADYQTRRAGVVTLGRQFFKIANGSVPAVAPASHSNGVVHEALVATVPSPVLTPVAKAVTVVEPPKPNGGMPDVPEVAGRIKTLLSPHKRERLRAVVFSERGGGEEIARKLGLQYASLQVMTGKLYAILGINKVKELKARKALLRQAFAFLAEEEARANPGPLHPLKGEGLVEPVVSTAAPSPAPTLEEPKTQPLLAPPAATPQARKETEAALPAKANGYGAGVVIPIPQDTINVDVVSGEFRNKEPSQTLREQLIERQRAGLKPSFVVLYPSGDDPTIARGHVIFLEREGRK